LFSCFFGDLDFDSKTQGQMSGVNFSVGPNITTSVVTLVRTTWAAQTLEI